MAVKPTMMKVKTAKTFKTTKTFSTLAAPPAPREINHATAAITTTATISTTPPLLPKVLAIAFGKWIPNGSNSPRKLADSPEPTKAKAMKYSANRAQPATQPKNSPNITLIHEYADPANGIAAAISA